MKKIFFVVAIFTLILSLFTNFLPVLAEEETSLEHPETPSDTVEESFSDDNDEEEILETEVSEEDNNTEIDNVDHEIEAEEVLEEESTETTLLEKAILNKTLEESGIEVEASFLSSAFDQEVSLHVTVLEEETDEYNETTEKLDQLSEETDEYTYDNYIFLDITFMNEGGEEVEPLEEVNIKISLAEEAIDTNDEVDIIHFDNEGNVEVLECESNEDNTEVVFVSNTFSTYALALNQPKKTIVAPKFTGFKTENGLTYYFKNGDKVLWEQKINGSYYYFDANGVMWTGWKWFPWQKRWSYFGEDGKRIANKEINLPSKENKGNFWYYFDSNGKMQYGWQYVASEKKWSYYNKYGRRIHGEDYLISREDGKPYHYYFDNNGKMQYGWQYISKQNKLSYFNRYGRRLTLREDYLISREDGKPYYYYFDKDGKMWTGWKWFPKQKRWSFYTEDGRRITGKEAEVLARENGRQYWYYFDANGKMNYGWKYFSNQNAWKYYNRYGRRLQDCEDYLVTPKGGSPQKYYLDSNGKMVCNTFININNNMYYYDSNGNKMLGQKKINNAWYYFNSDTGILKTGTFTIPAKDNYGVAKRVVTDEKGRFKLSNYKDGLTYYSIISDEDAEYINARGDDKIKVLGSIRYTKKIYKEGVDISEWNGNFDFASHKDKFIIIRASWDTVQDNRVEEYVKKCEQLKIPYGFYVYSYALTEKGAEEEANFFLKVLDKVKKQNGGKLNHFKMGVWFDMEDADTWKARNWKNTKLSPTFQSKKVIAPICEKFCSIVSKKGYYTGIYMSYSWLQYVNGTSCDKYPKWIAHWGMYNDNEMTSDMSSYGPMQQYTSAGNLDKDVIFKDLSTFANKSN